MTILDSTSPAATGNQAIDYGSAIYTGSSDPNVSPYAANVSLVLLDKGYEILNWTEYAFNADYMTPTDAFHFTMDDPGPSVRKVAINDRVALKVNGKTQATGRVDRISITVSRAGGTSIHLSGRCAMARLIDACVDPNIRIPRNQTLLQTVQQIASPFGISVITDSNDANRNVITGGLHSYKTTKKGKPIKSVVNHELKPYPHEGTFAFMTRLTHRFGLWPRMDATGQTIILATPDFNQPALYSLQNFQDVTGSNNVLEAQCDRDASEQPTYIIATGFGGGAESPYAKNRCFALNPSIGLETKFNQLVQILAENKDARYVDLSKPQLSDYYYEPFAVPLYLHDDESKSPDELESFVRREMSIRLRKAFEYTCTVEGHVQDGYPWAIDTMVNVQDDICNVHEPLWIMSRTFVQTRSSGTETHLKLLRANSLVL